MPASQQTSAHLPPLPSWMLPCSCTTHGWAALKCVGMHATTKQGRGINNMTYGIYKPRHFLALGRCCLSLKPAAACPSLQAACGNQPPSGSDQTPKQLAIPAMWTAVKVLARAMTAKDNCDALVPSLMAAMNTTSASEDPAAVCRMAGALAAMLRRPAFYNGAWLHAVFSLQGHLLFQVVRHSPALCYHASAVCARADSTLLCAALLWLLAGACDDQQGYSMPGGDPYSPGTGGNYTWPANSTGPSGNYTGDSGLI